MEKNQIVSNFFFVSFILLFATIQVNALNCGAGDCTASCQNGCVCMRSENNPSVCNCACFRSPEENDVFVAFGDEEEVNASFRGEFDLKELEKYFNAVFKEPVVLPRDFKISSLSNYNKSKIKVSALRKELGLLTLDEFKQESAKMAKLNFFYGIIASALVLTIAYMLFLRKK